MSRLFTEELSFEHAYETGYDVGYKDGLLEGRRIALEAVDKVFNGETKDENKMSKM